MNSLSIHITSDIGPLPGAFVYKNDAPAGVSNGNGDLFLEAAEGDVIRATFLGFISDEATVNPGTTALALNLKQSGVTTETAVVIDRYKRWYQRPAIVLAIIALLVVGYLILKNYM
jgi:hypothetical protein